MGLECFLVFLSVFFGFLRMSVDGVWMVLDFLDEFWFIYFYFNKFYSGVLVLGMYLVGLGIVSFVFVIFIKGKVYIYIVFDFEGDF